MAVKLRSGGNGNLLELGYSDKQTLKRLLSNWCVLESMSERGNRDATCILYDLKEATGIDIDKFNAEDYNEFLKGRNDKILNEIQFVSIAFVLVLGYPQYEIAKTFNVTQQAISKGMKIGIERISDYLEYRRIYYECI